MAYPSEDDPFGLSQWRPNLLDLAMARSPQSDPPAQPALGPWTGKPNLLDLAMAAPPPTPDGNGDATDSPFGLPSSKSGNGLLGAGYQDPAETNPALTLTKSPFGSSDGADPWAAGNMADVLLRKSDYADAVTHYLGQAKADPAGTRAELAAVYDKMAGTDPASAVKFASQMKAAGLADATAAKDDTSTEAAPTPLVIDVYNTHPEGDPFDPNDGDSIQVAERPQSRETVAPFDPRVGDAKTPPDWKKDTFKSQPGAWEGFHRSVDNLPGAGTNEKFAYGQIYAPEGGNAVDARTKASSGITRQTLLDARTAGAVPGLDKVQSPQDLTADQRAGIMRWYFDDILRKSGGSAALEEFTDAGAAAALADTLYEHGRSGGATLLQQAVNMTDPKRGLPEDDKMGPGTFEAFKALANDPATRDALLKNLAEARNKATNGAEKDRMEHFRFPR